MSSSQNEDCNHLVSPYTIFVMWVKQGVQMTHIYLIRHAANIDGLINGKTGDLGLSPEGITQAERLRDRLAGRFGFRCWGYLNRYTIAGLQAPAGLPNDGRIGLHVAIANEGLHARAGEVGSTVRDPLVQTLVGFVIIASSSWAGSSPAPCWPSSAPPPTRCAMPNSSRYVSCSRCRVS